MATIFRVRHGSPVRGCLRLLSSLFTILSVSTYSVWKEITTPPLSQCHGCTSSLSSRCCRVCPCFTCMTSTSAAMSASKRSTLASLFSFPLFDVCLAFSPPSSYPAAAKLRGHPAKPVNDKHVISTSPVTVPLHVLIMQAVAMRCSLRRRLMSLASLDVSSLAISRHRVNPSLSRCRPQWKAGSLGLDQNVPVERIRSANTANHLFPLGFHRRSSRSATGAREAAEQSGGRGRTGKQSGGRGGKKRGNNVRQNGSRCCWVWIHRVGFPTPQQPCSSPSTSHPEATPLFVFCSTSDGPLSPGAATLHPVSNALISTEVSLEELLPHRNQGCCLPNVILAWFCSQGHMRQVVCRGRLHRKSVDAALASRPCSTASNRHGLTALSRR